MNLLIKNNYITQILERKKLLLWSIFLLGLLLRIAFIIFWDRRLNYDTQNYIAQAEGILSGNPISGFPNGYPLIIAAVIFLTGKNLIFPVMISLNLVAQFFTGYFLYKFSKLLFSESPIHSINPRKSAKIRENPREIKKSNLFTLSVLFLFAIYPTQILYTNSVLTETITTLFITASVYGIINNSYFLGGLSLALASMLRTSFLPALAITFLYILFTSLRTHPRPSAKIRENLREPENTSLLENPRSSASISENLRAERQSINHQITQSPNPRETSSAKISENLRAERQSINQSVNPRETSSAKICVNSREPKKSSLIKYFSGFALVLSFFALLNFTGITKFPINQNYNLLIAINSRSSSINHNISNFSESDFVSPLQTYINFADNNTKEFIIQRADALWGLWGVIPFETNHLYSKLLLSIRTFLFLSWIYWLFIIFRKKYIYRNTVFHKFFILLSILIITTTIVHTIYFSSFRFIVPLEPVLLILFVFTIFRFFSFNQSFTQSFNKTNN